MDSAARTTLIVLAKDIINKNAFYFNTSTELREPSNKFKELLDFFELPYINLEVSKKEYIYNEFTYTFCEELPYPNYNKENQKEINVVKRRYIKNYSEKEYQLINITLNTKAKLNSETKKHRNNLNNLLNKLSYKFLKDRYDHLQELVDYHLLKSYLKDYSNRITSDISSKEVSKRYLAGNENAGIEILLRKKERELFSKLSDSRHLNNYEYLIKVYKFATHLEKLEDFDAYLLAWYIYGKYPYNRTPVLRILINQMKDGIIEYFNNKDNSKLDKLISNEHFMSIRNFNDEYLMDAYIQEEPSKEDLKIGYLYVLYHRICKN